ncbi:uncharacterized protein LOC130550372 [Triplophysa rosa]|uniref:Uncharacterized protein n=1 Tax=Triplophysa rosa TaxID=992332 RepID=A0A9W7W9X1_TRIRA|nr:uncharacterized protein LOC130550372 [Triplophysa rosa]KAI7790428.1 hypothetical protein IRJ41_001514 [Triplophysa rosa]
MANADQPDTVFCVGRNSRGRTNVSHDGHIGIEDLRIKIEKNASKICNDFAKKHINYKLKICEYLSKIIPNYPTPVEIHISEVTHVTDEDSLREILDSGGFQGCGRRNYTFSWWSLKIVDKSIRAAEQRYLEDTLPNRTQEQRERQKPFLNKFTTSPAFDNEKSRYGNFRFTFPLTELMERYRNEMCGGQNPVLREFKTIFYRQEIMYVVLIHSPEVNEKFKNFREIESSLFVDYKEDTIIWKAQAICNNLQFQLLLNEENKIAVTEPVINQFYVWDHITLAFYFNGVLHFPKEKLIECLTCCETADINLSRSDDLSLEEAKEILCSLTVQ